MFQTFLRYEFSCSIKPKASILKAASTQKIPRKYGSVASNATACVVRSPPGKCSSIAITKLQRIIHWSNHMYKRQKLSKMPTIAYQLAIIVQSTVYSNGGHSIMNLANRLIGCSSPKRNNDVGPGGAGGTGACWAGTSSVLTFCFDAVDVCAVTTAFGCGAFVDPSCAANLYCLLSSEKNNR